MSSLGGKLNFYATLLTANRPASRCFRWLLAYLVVYLVVTYIVGRVAGDWPQFLVGGVGVLGMATFAKIAASRGPKVSENTDHNK